MCLRCQDNHEKECISIITSKWSVLFDALEPRLSYNEVHRYRMTIKQQFFSTHSSISRRTTGPISQKHRTFAEFAFAQTASKPRQTLAGLAIITQRQPKNVFKHSIQHLQPPSHIARISGFFDQEQTSLYGRHRRPRL